MAKFFINRPIVAMVISIIMVIVGIVAILGLPIAQFPNIVPPEIFINTTYVGADAQTVEQSVATPIEQQMSGVDNMNYMYSLNANNGELKLYVNFDVKTDPNIDQVLTQMRKSPGGLASCPPRCATTGSRSRSPRPRRSCWWRSTRPSGTYDATFLANYAYINLNDQLTRVPGIASVTVFGAGQYAMRLWVKPDQLAKLNITVPEIVDAIKKQNTVNPAGQVGGEPAPPGQEFTYAIRAQGRLETAEEFGEIVLRANPDGSHRAAEGCGAHRAGRPDLRHVGPVERQAGGRARPLPAARLQRDRGRGRRQEADGRGEEDASRPTWTTASRSTRPRPCARASRRSSRPSARR